MSNPEIKIVIYACNWDGLSCIEAASQVGHCYPAGVNIIRVTCLSRIHLGLILKAFELGADGVMLLGCEPGNCYFQTDSGLITREFTKAQEVLKLLGLTEDRLVLSYLPRGDGYSFVRRITDFITNIKRRHAAAPAISRH